MQALGAGARGGGRELAARADCYDASGVAGDQFIAAVTLVAEIGDLHRFDSAKQLMAWLGLVPVEHSSGTRIRRGELTRTGNAAARAMLIESAWHYRYPAREGRALRERNARLPITSGRSPGRRRRACARSSAVWREQASTQRRSWRRSRVSWPASSGTLPVKRRCLSQGRLDGHFVIGRWFTIGAETWLACYVSQLTRTILDMAQGRIFRCPF